MLEQLMNLVRQEAPQALAGTGGLPHDQQDAIQTEAAHSVFSGMQDIAQTQGPAGLKSLFSAAEHGDTSNPQMQMLTNNFAGSLSQKFGLGGGMGKTIAMALVPMILSRVFRRTKDPNDNGFNIQDMLGSLMGGGRSEGGLGGMLGGGGGGGLGGMLGGALSGAMGGGSQRQQGGGGMLGGALDRDGDGDTDLQDLMRMFR
jgi:hypothetical protein